MKKKANKWTKFFALTMSIIMVVAIATVAVFSATNQMQNGNNVINITNTQKANVNIKILELEKQNSTDAMGKSLAINTFVFTEKFSYNFGGQAEALNNLNSVHFDNKSSEIIYKIIINNLEENTVKARLSMKGLSYKKVQIFVGDSVKKLDNCTNFDNLSKFELAGKQAKEAYIKMISSVNEKGENISKNVNFFNLAIELTKLNI